MFLDFLDTLFAVPDEPFLLNRGAKKMFDRDMRELMPLLQLYRNMGGPEKERMYEAPEATRQRARVQET